MAFDEETAYATEYNHLGSLGLSASHYVKDAGGQTTATYNVYVSWQAHSTKADYGSGNFSPTPSDSTLVFWKGAIPGPAPVSGDVITIDQDWIVTGVVETRHSSWVLTVREAAENA